MASEDLPIWFITGCSSGCGRWPSGAARSREIRLARPPRHLVLGAVGLKHVRKSLEEKLEEITAWEQTGLGTDYPPA